jgi:hypothetical protein
MLHVSIIADIYPFWLLNPYITYHPRVSDFGDGENPA